jgi:glycosyltransferase involved in cell wall biosynthesis
MTRVPAVSVVMTAFNRERLIGAAIESVLAQTFVDFELIVVDDCSTDRTVEMVKPFLSDPRVRLVQNERNRGDYPNRNHAATFATGGFLKYHDSDDLMYPHCLDVMVHALAAEPSAAFALTTHRSWSGGPCPMLLTPHLAYAREFLGHGLFHVGPSCALFRREAFLELGRFPEVGVHSDTLFWLRACARVSVLLVAGDLFWYRIHDGQEMQAERAAYDGASLESTWWRAITDANCPLTPDERELAKRNAAGRLLRTLLRDVRRGAWRLAIYRARTAGLTPGDWLRYGRRPRLSFTAGSPLGPDADYVVPASLVNRRT